MKTLKSFLEGYRPKSSDEQRFVDKHVIAKIGDRNGNGDDVFNATNVKPVKREKERHGYDPKEDEKVYEETLDETLHPSMGRQAYIDEFIKSKHPMFANDDKKQRIKRALGAYYKAKKALDAKKTPTNEEIDRMVEMYSENLSESKSLNISRRFVEKYSTIQETTEVTQEQLLDSLIEGLGEINQNIILDVFQKLDESNRETFLIKCSTPEGLNEMIDFCIENRNA